MGGGVAGWKWLSFIAWWTGEENKSKPFKRKGRQSFSFPSNNSSGKRPLDLTYPINSGPNSLIPEFLQMFFYSSPWPPRVAFCLQSGYLLGPRSFPQSVGYAVCCLIRAQHWAGVQFPVANLPLCLWCKRPHWHMIPCWNHHTPHSIWNRQRPYSQMATVFFLVLLLCKLAHEASH